MVFNTKKDLELYLNNLIEIGYGSQGTVYLNPVNNKTFKIFAVFEDDEYFIHYTKEELLKFKSIVNNTFIWAEDVIMINDIIYGYISNYVDAKNLYKIDPLSININTFENSVKNAKKDIKLITNNRIKTFDVMYNIMYNGSFYVIDQDEYCYSENDYDKLLKHNNEQFDYEIYWFLIDRYFDEVVKNNTLLRELYKDKKENVLLFISALKQNLSELVGNEITYLSDASKYINKQQKSTEYVRSKIKIR